MTPDVNIKSFYLQYVHNAKADIAKYNDNLKTITKLKAELHKYLEDNKKLLKEVFNIKLENFNKEFVEQTYNTNKSLYNIAIKLIKNVLDHPNKVVLLQIAKYCNILEQEHKHHNLIYLASKRKDLKFSEYRKYITAYYNAVHKCVLQGMGYRFSSGIGVYVINCWKLDKNRMRNKPHIDFAATNIKKKELLAKGYKLYDDKEAAWYQARNIPYDGVDYRVYKTQTDWYEFAFIKSKLFHKNCFEYKRTEYVAAKYRGMSYKDIADLICKTEEDIYSLQVDIKYKLNILIYKFPIKYLNFVRNADQCKYKY